MLETAKNYIESCGKIIPFSKIATKTEHVYKGVKNKTEFPKFIELCKLTQTQLKIFLVEKLIESGYTDIISGDGYVYAKGTFPVLLTAHMDTVHKEIVKDFYEETTDKGEHIISSPQGIGGDDRCGVYMILEIIKEHKCSVLFCEDEEIGRVGAKKFVETEYIEDLKQMNYLIELDRKGSEDAVFYQCYNKDFTKFITENTGYEKAYGSYSDISTLAPACGVAAVNFSCGYYNAHKLTEEVHVEEMLNTIETVKNLLKLECEQFEYVEYKYDYKSYGSCYGNYSYSDYWKEYYKDYNYDEHNKCSKNSESQQSTDEDEEDEESYYSCVTLSVLYLSAEESQGNTVTSYGNTKAEAWMNFFMDYPHVCYNDVIDWDYDYE